MISLNNELYKCYREKSYYRENEEKWIHFEKLLEFILGQKNKMNMGFYS